MDNKPVKFVVPYKSIISIFDYNKKAGWKFEALVTKQYELMNNAYLKVLDNEIEKIDKQLDRNKQAQIASEQALIALDELEKACEEKTFDRQYEKMLELIKVAGMTTEDFTDCSILLQTQKRRRELLNK